MDTSAARLVDRHYDNAARLPVFDELGKTTGTPHVKTRDTAAKVSGTVKKAKRKAKRAARKAQR